SNLKKSAKSVVTIIVFTLASKVLGFLREALIASKYGSGAGTDTYFIALSAVSLFSVLLTQTINTTLIPILSDVEAQEGKKGKLNHLNNFLNTVTIIAFILVVIGYFVTPLLMTFLGKGFVGEQFEFAILLTRIGLPMLIFSSVVGVFRGYLQSEEFFNESAAAAFPKNIVYILFLIFLSQYFSIKALMVAAVIAEASQLLIQIPSLRKLGYRYKMNVDLQDEYMQRLAALIPPILISVAISDLNNLIDKSMASSLVKGSVSSLNYASVLNNIVMSVFVTAIITVIFPMLSKEANAENYNGLKKLMHTSLNIVLLITIPAAIGMIVLATPAVKFAYQRGEFGEAATMMTSSALVYYSLGLVGNGVKGLLTRVYYSLKDTKTPMINSAYALGLNFIFNLVLVQFMGHRGLALATSLSTTITAIILLHHLRKKIGNLGLKAMIQSSVKILVSSLIMGVAVYFTYHSLMAALSPSRLVELILVFLTVLIGIAVYIAALYLFKVDELHFAIDYTKRQLKERKQNKN
ncbi:MAG TPA: murein biosynthesis integral membrane protein MurJ, partial [Pseudogracilibacillus sp.]|nr:murein biosynthesis integral membrane protein MurJ [Pseudogracilibacillus sp.]